LRLIDGRIRTLPGVLHIPRLAKNLIFIRKINDARVKKILKRKPVGWFEEKWCCLRELGLELCISCKEALLLMGVKVPLFLILELKKKKLLQSLEKRLLIQVDIGGPFLFHLDPHHFFF
jgi:hypothetical protein